MPPAKKKKIAETEEILELLTASMRGEILEEAVARQTIEKGEPFEKPLSPRDRMRAAELLGRRYRLFSDPIEERECVQLVIEDHWQPEEDS